jgi:hypothetical protein
MDVSLDGATSKRAVCMPVEDAARQTLTLYLSATLVERESACICVVNKIYTDTLFTQNPM